MSKQFFLDQKYLQMAEIWATNSTSERLKVGCLVVKDRLIISDGYNGTPAGFDNNCEDRSGNTKPEVLHAEANAITKLATSTQSSVDATIYITAAPCVECAKLIIQAQIKRVVYLHDYKNMDGINLLYKALIKVEKF